jgi:hypothetical protein
MWLQGVVYLRVLIIVLRQEVLLIMDKVIILVQAINNNIIYIKRIKVFQKNLIKKKNL